MKRALRRPSALLVFALVAVSPPDVGGAADPSAADAGAAEPNDPWEPFNRPVFAFNDFLSEYALEPVGRGWKWLVPGVVRESISRVFQNARTPAVMVNDLLQGKPRAAGVDLARFLMNSSIGLAGILDPAAAVGLESNREDFGQTFGVWGIPPGPYLVLPLLGPSSPRDAVGSAADAASRGWGWFIPIWASASLTGLETFNETSFFAEDLAAEREAAFDWYAAVRNAHVSRRENLVRDRAEASTAEAEDEDDLYLLEEEDDELEGAADPEAAAEEAQP
jgi:phospholipid-binding lipoprotein MlaA